METDYQTFKLRLFVPVNWFLLRAAVLWLLVPLCSNSKIHAVLSAVLFIYVIGVTITLLAVFSLYLEMKSTSWGKGGEMAVLNTIIPTELQKPAQKFSC